MTSIMRVANSIGKSTAERMKEIGIDSVEKLASSSIENLLVMDGIGVKNAKKYILFAQKHIERIKAREKIYTIINKGVASNTSRLADILNIPKPFDKKSNPRAPISSIKKLASSSIDDLSKLKGMNSANAQKYIKIAKKYLKGMRKEEIASNVSSSESKPQSQLLGLVKFDNKRYPHKLKTEIPPRKKKDSYLEKPHLDYKSTIKPIPEIKLIKQPTYGKNVKKKKLAKTEKRDM